MFVGLIDNRHYGARSAARRPDGSTALRFDQGRPDDRGPLAPAAHPHPRQGAAAVTPARRRGMTRLEAISGKNSGSEKVWMGQTHVAPGPAPATTTTARPRPRSTCCPGTRCSCSPTATQEIRLETEPGDYIFVPPYVPHREENPGDGGGRRGHRPQQPGGASWSTWTASGPTGREPGGDAGAVAVDVVADLLVHEPDQAGVVGGVGERVEAADQQGGDAQRRRSPAAPRPPARSCRPGRWSCRPRRWPSAAGSTAACRGRRPRPRCSSRCEPRWECRG